MMTIIILMIIMLIIIVIIMMMMTIPVSSPPSLKQPLRRKIPALHGLAGAVVGYDVEGEARLGLELGLRLELGRE